MILCVTVSWKALKVQSVYGPGPVTVSFAAKLRLYCCCAFVWTLDSGSKDSSSLKIVMDPGSWTLGPIWIVIVHARRPSDPSGPSDPSEPSDPSRLLLCMLEGISQLGIQGIFRARPAPGQSWAPEFYGASS